MGARAPLPLAALAAIAAAIAALLPLYGGSNPPAPRRPAPEASAPVKEAERAPPASRSEASGWMLQLRPPHEAADGLTLLHGGTRVKLAGLSGPALNDICVHDSGELWACGRQARVALYNLARGRALACVSVGSSEEAVLARCDAEGLDLRRAVVAEGWARPLIQNEFAEEVQQARQARLGLWRSDWRIR